MFDIILANLVTQAIPAAITMALTYVVALPISAVLRKLDAR